MTDYKTCLKELTTLIGSYPKIRQTGSPEEIQELRDRISEELYHFGDTYALIRSESERAESAYKMCCEENKVIWRKKFNNKQVGLADMEAVLECGEALETMHQKNEDFYLAQTLISRSDQILNSISSRLKLGIKHE